jgi:hypothetical protein
VSVLWQAEARAMQVETDEPEVIERVAALDVSKAEVVCCARVPGPAGRRMQEVRSSSAWAVAGHAPRSSREAARLAGSSVRSTGTKPNPGK